MKYEWTQNGGRRGAGAGGATNWAPPLIPNSKSTTHYPFYTLMSTPEYTAHPVLGKYTPVWRLAGR